MCRPSALYRSKLLPVSEIGVSSHQMFLADVFSAFGLTRRATCITVNEPIADTVNDNRPSSFFSARFPRFRVVGRLGCDMPPTVTLSGVHDGERR